MGVDILDEARPVCYASRMGLELDWKIAGETNPASSRAWIKSKLFFSYSHSSSKFSTMNSRLGNVHVGWMGLMSFAVTCASGNFLPGSVLWRAITRIQLTRQYREPRFQCQCPGRESSRGSLLELYGVLLSSTEASCQPISVVGRSGALILTYDGPGTHKRV